MANVVDDPFISESAVLTVNNLRPTKSTLLEKLLNSSVISGEHWKNLSVRDQEDLKNYSSSKQLLPLLVKHNLLTEYQAERVEAGATFGLILGNYRVLERLGTGGMGVVYKGEHLRMRRQVAIKVLPMHEADTQHLERFLGEMQAIAELQHPNIVFAIDDGEVSDPGTNSTPLHFFVMEYVPGQDLETLVQKQGPLPREKACGLIYQVASALAEAHKHNLVHRDIKPSNIQVTPDGQAKLLDFGIVRHFNNRMTEPGALVGTPAYLAPEQANDARSVDIRADIFALGGTLFWCLTGQIPFPETGNLIQNLVRRLTQSPPSVRAVNPEISGDLDAVLFRMMACNRDDRYPNPQAVMNALLPFLNPEPEEYRRTFTLLQHEPGLALPAATENSSNLHRVLVVDDSSSIRKGCVSMLQKEGITCDSVANGLEALEAMNAKSYDLVLTDWIMPGMTGLELCRKLRADAPSANLKIVLFSAQVTDDEVSQVLAAGADDYLNKQFSSVQLVARVKAALRLKEAQDRADLLNRHLLVCNRQLEQNLLARDSDLVQVRNALVLGLSDLVACRDTESTCHIVRLQGYCRCLAAEAASHPSFAGQIDSNFIQMLECCVPLHDIGKAGLPDNVLMKSGKLDTEERLLMQTHTIIGAETLQRIAQRHGSAVGFLQMAIDIARSHHERYDGTGYPDQLAGCTIPLAARILSIGDAYDGLRSSRPYKPALDHSTAMKMMVERSNGQFDPALFRAFERISPQFEQVFRDMAG